MGDVVDDHASDTFFYSQARSLVRRYERASNRRARYWFLLGFVAGPTTLWALHRLWEVYTWTPS